MFIRVKASFFLLTLAACFLVLSGQPGFAKEGAIEIIEKNVQFKSHDLLIRVGQTIRLKNNDPYMHMSQVRKLNKHGIETEIVGGGVEMPGTTQDIVIPNAGDYKLRCILHDGMVLNIKASK